MKSGKLLMELEKVKELLNKIPEANDVSLQNISSYLESTQFLKERVVKMVEIGEEIKKEMGLK
jgi:hypothetical protein